ncbi:GNAT family N-acetyltransferase [Cellulophaga omnivescoria]|uniref:GNAT family N-acetyltransferase n=1 Tax=Cellulophaga omnivescoria TaxID=1888890 RepID=UPI00098709A6|nr:GNAT family N-acetyltransferase [Cellulophaga omnivescoria]WBU89429.1 GNAT family N-acetyltransferase [Cellulophaga omnivescoria]WKB81453.1 GNAT family N-acetyltransferase [Cellulophaga lytica]
MVTVKKATVKDISSIAPLFNNYRIFYKQESNLEAATLFLKERLTKEQSHIFIAFKGVEAVGFTQLYTSYSSVSLLPIFILNDLFVDANHRSKNIGAALLQKAQEFCLFNNYKGIALETATNNPAQKLYEKLNWKKDTNSFHYFWTAN